MAAIYKYFCQGFGQKWGLVASKSKIYCPIIFGVIPYQDIFTIELNFLWPLHLPMRFQDNITRV